MKISNRTKRVNIMVDPEIWADFMRKSREQGTSASASIEVWMKSILNSEQMMKGFDSMFAVLVDAEVKKRLEK